MSPSQSPSIVPKARPLANAKLPIQRRRKSKLPPWVGEVGQRPGPLVGRRGIGSRFCRDDLRPGHRQRGSGAPGASGVPGACATSAPPAEAPGGAGIDRRERTGRQSGGVVRATCRHRPGAGAADPHHLGGPCDQRDVSRDHHHRRVPAGCVEVASQRVGDRRDDPEPQHRRRHRARQPDRRPGAGECRSAGG